MKEKLFNTIIILISIYVLIILLIKKSIVYSSIIYALNLWVNNLIPALFPFFIISDILINYNITDYIPKIIKKICKYIFNITDNMLTIFLLSMISGFPSNARNTRLLYDKGELSLEEANHILLFSHFSNPVFILTTVTVFFLHNERLGIPLLIIHYLSNFILGFLFRNKFCYKKNSNNKVDNNIKRDFGNIFVNSIKRSIDTILMICGIVLVFLLLSTIVVDTFNFNSYNTMIIKGLFEITIGIEELSKLSLDYSYKLVISSMILAFGGISVHVQVFSQIANTKIKYIYFFVGRMYQMIISGILAFITSLFLGI